MQYLHKYAVLPPSPGTRDRVEQAAQKLASRLRRMDIGALPISDYNKRYLGSYLADLDPVLQRYAFILAWALAPGDGHGSGPSVLLDYGGGTGMLSMMARAAGVRTVLYNDIFDASCRDASVIARQLDLEADGYIHGEIDAVVGVLRSRDLDVDVVANNDVIEHIYDIESFIRRLPELSRRTMSTSLATGANSQNPYLRRRLQRLHRHREYDDRVRQWGHKDGESVLSYRTVRANIIRAHAKELQESEVQRLADLTRGMMRKDIEAATDEYTNHRRWPAAPKHPTNTCDPETGSWAEHLMDHAWLKGLMSGAGFEARAVPGPYGWRASPAKRLAARVLDTAISRLRDPGVLLSPFIIVHGTRRGAA